MTIFLISAFIAVSISAMCSLLEAIVLSLTPSQIADIVQKNPRVGKIWQQFKQRIDRPIAVILILNTAAHTIGATIAGSKVEELYGSVAVIWFSIIFTYVMLQFTEVLPKTLGVRYNRKLSAVAIPLLLLTRVFQPVLWFIHLINRPFERRNRLVDDPTLEEMTALAGMARLTNLIGPHQERIIRGASRLSRMTVGQVMIPVTEITFMSTSNSIDDAIVVAHDDPHTRFPIHKENNVDDVVGYINFKEMVYWSKTNPNNPGLTGIIRPVQFVSPDEPAAQLLRIFVDLHEHMAIVRAQDGKTLGLVTLEDLVEELLGDLQDEFDHLPRQIHALQGDAWMVGGGVHLRDISSRMDISFQNPDITMSDWLISELGHVPKVNEHYVKAGITFTIRRIRRTKIFEVLVTKNATVDGKRVI